MTYAACGWLFITIIIQVMFTVFHRTWLTVMLELLWRDFRHGISFILSMYERLVSLFYYRHL